MIGMFHHTSKTTGRTPGRTSAAAAPPASLPRRLQPFAPNSIQRWNDAASGHPGKPAILRKGMRRIRNSSRSLSLKRKRGNCSPGRTGPRYRSGNRDTSHLPGSFAIPSPAPRQSLPCRLERLCMLHSKVRIRHPVFHSSHLLHFHCPPRSSPIPDLSGSIFNRTGIVRFQQPAHRHPFVPVQPHHHFFFENDA